MNHLLNNIESENKSVRLKSAKRTATIGYFASFIVFGLLASAIGPTLPGMAENTQSQLAQISFIFTAQSLGYLSGSVSGGRLFDRLPGHPLLALVMIGMAVLAFFIPFASALWFLIAVFLVLGVMQGALEVGNNTLLVWLHKEQVGPYMNALHFFFGLGAILSPIIVARSIAGSGDFRWVYWTLSLLALPVAVWLIRLPSPLSPNHHESDQTGQANSLLVFIVALLLFLYVGAEVSYAGWVFTYSTNQFSSLAASSAALLTSAFWGAFTLSRLVSIPMAVRVKAKVVLVVDSIGCLVSVGIIMLFPESLTALWVGTLGLGIFMAAFFPTTVTLAGQCMQITGRVSGWFFVGAGAGGMILPWIIGQLFESVGPGVVLTLILVDLSFAFFVLGGFLFLTSTTSTSRDISLGQP
jgi:MFS transporter, FHS family, Na+ dependent glucose transporter 1